MVHSRLLLADLGLTPPIKETSLVKEEDRSVGVVSWSTWKAYVASSGFCRVGLVLSLFVLGQGLLMVSDWWLMVWSTTDKGDSWGWVYGTYAALAVSTVVVSFLRANLFFMATLKASRCV